jgi:uncharacterized membrane protein YgcG
MHNYLLVKGMQKAVVLLVIILVISALPPISGQFLKLQTTGEITVLRGDYSSKAIQLTNAGGITYKVVSYQRFWVEDSEGNTVGGFNLTMSPTVFSDWSAKTTRTAVLNVTCASNVSGGDYTLHLRFLAFTSSGSMYILTAEIPLHVIASPLEFGVAEAYVKERPSSGYALNGETIVVFSHVKNVGHRNVTATGEVRLVSGDRVYFSTNRTLLLVPGDNLVKFEIPIGYSIPEGSYRVEYRILGPGGEEYSYSKSFQVRFGVALVGISLQSDSVDLNGVNKAYLTLLSERVAELNLTVEAYREGTLVAMKTEQVKVVGGTDVVEVGLPTNVSGEILAVMKLTFDGWLVGSGNVTYTVIAPPVLKNVSYEWTPEGKVTFTLTVFNPSEGETAGILTYRISTDDGVLYKDSVQQSIPPGLSEVKLKFEVPVGRKVYYEFSLDSAGKTSILKGEFLINPPVSSTTTTTSTTSPTSTTSSVRTSNTTSSGGGGAGGRWIMLLLIVVVLAAGVFYYVSLQESGKKKRSRPKPKRHSPLGRFRRPKKPEFKENKELPKKK